MNGSFCGTSPFVDCGLFIVTLCPENPPCDFWVLQVIMLTMHHLIIPSHIPFRHFEERHAR